MICLLCQHPIEDGYLCVHCVKDTRVRIEAWPMLYEGLGLFLTPEARGSQGRGAKPVYAPLPVSEDVLDLRGPGGLVGVAEGWAAAIRRDRGMAAPIPQGSIAGRLQAAVTALLGHLPWVAISWPDAGAFATDIRDVTTSIASIFAPRVPADQGTRLGACPARLPDGTLCGAALRLMPGEKAATCKWCATVWPPCTWAQLKTWQDEDTKAADAA